MLAKASLQLGDAKAAESIFHSMGRNDDAFRAALWAGNWAGVSGSSVRELSRAAEFAVGNGASASNMGVVSKGRSLSDEARDVKAVISDIVNW
ncbi:hypothetical protein HOY34_20165 [Xinfangfangia sp. D13-10-4-6]|nr:hypothetical protein [Pseudogemmobacter hezensis]